MFDEQGGAHPIAPVLAHSLLFSHVEPVADIASPLQGDLYLQLARTIEREVIPRLLLNTRIEIARQDALRALEVSQTSSTVIDFCRLVLTQEMREVERRVKDYLAAGVSAQSLLLELFAPAARRLGELWDADECSFFDVTVALGKLQRLLRLFSETYSVAPDPKKLGFRALLSAVPLNEHTFGVAIVEQLFKRAGWNVLSLPTPSREEIKEAVRNEWFGIVGLSIGCDSSAPSIASLIQDIRSASMNRAVIVLVGGRYINDNPEQAGIFGADLAGSSVQEALVRSEEFLKMIND